MKKKNTKIKSKPIEQAFIAEYKRQFRLFGIILAVAAVVGAIAIGYKGIKQFEMLTFVSMTGEGRERKGDNWGEFLAGLHAMQVSDFKAMKKFSETMANSDSKIVKNTVMRAAFMSGGAMPGKMASAGEKTLVPLAIDFASLAVADKWKEAHKLLKNKEVFILAPARIVSAVAAGQPEQAQKIADSYKMFPDVMNFYKGFAYAISGYPKAAKKYFDLLPDDFLNLNDFLFMRAFYIENKMPTAADALTERFRNNPRGSFIADIEDLPDWSNYNTLQKQARFALTSIIAQNPFMIGTGWGLVALRTAEATVGGAADDSLNYYLGMNFSASGKAEYFFDKIPDSSAFKPFVMVHLSDQSPKALEKLVKKYPSFVPAAARLVLIKIADGDFKRALAITDKALDFATDASPATTAYLLKLRAHINYLSGFLYDAENDINEASNLSPKDQGLIADKARIWAAMGQNLEEAYELATALIKYNPGVSDYWDAIGVVLTAQGMASEASRIFERVQRIEPDVSSYAEHAGDAYAEAGHINRAKGAYKRALELKADGQINAREVRKKLNRLK